MLLLHVDDGHFIHKMISTMAGGNSQRGCHHGGFHYEGESGGACYCIILNGLPPLEHAQFFVSNNIFSKHRLAMIVVTQICFWPICLQQEDDHT